MTDMNGIYMCEQIKEQGQEEDESKIRNKAGLERMSEQKNEYVQERRRRG